jgi:hypothetical protein
MEVRQENDAMVCVTRMTQRAGGAGEPVSRILPNNANFVLFF